MVLQPGLDTLIALRNNVFWVILLPLLTVGLGLSVAVLVDRVRYEGVVKTVVFLPLAISFVAAGVIWRFMYDLDPNVGTLNAVVTAAGGDPVAWLVGQPWNNFWLILVGVWLLTGFSMVILSAGLKGISVELLEAARVDGANEIQVFRGIVLPLLAPTIAVVATTIIIYALKTFDVVYTMTSGLFDTNVVATGDVPGALQQHPAGSRGGDRRHPAARDRAGHGLQHPSLPTAGGSSMTAATEARRSRSARGPVGAGPGRASDGSASTLSLVALMVLWAIPAVACSWPRSDPQSPRTRAAGGRRSRRRGTSPWPTTSTSSAGRASTRRSSTASSSRSRRRSSW